MFVFLVLLQTIIGLRNFFLTWTMTRDDKLSKNFAGINFRICVIGIIEID